jgi:hypothetical protein
MAAFFDQLKDWETQANEIQADYERQIEAYQAQAELYKSEVVTYQEAALKRQIAQAAAVTAAEGVIDTFYTGFGWSYVNKEDPVAYWSKITYTWAVQSGIIMILFVAILYLQKRKDVT